MPLLRSHVPSHDTVKRCASAPVKGVVRPAGALARRGHGPLYRCAGVPQVAVMRRNEAGKGAQTGCLCFGGRKPELEVDIALEVMGNILVDYAYLVYRNCRIAWIGFGAT